MFLCEKCTNEHRKKFPKDGQSILPMSVGRCEGCGETKECYEVYIHHNDEETLVVDSQQMRDITAPEFLEFKIRSDGKVVWINDKKKCIFRACRIGKLIVTDERPRGSSKLEKVLAILKEDKHITAGTAVKINKIVGKEAI